MEKNIAKTDTVPTTRAGAGRISGNIRSISLPAIVLLAGSIRALPAPFLLV